MTGDEGFSLAVYESIFGKNLDLLKNSVFVALLFHQLALVKIQLQPFNIRLYKKTRVLLVDLGQLLHILVIRAAERS